MNDEIQCSINPNLLKPIQSIILWKFSNDKTFFINTLNIADRMFIIYKGLC